MSKIYKNDNKCQVCKGNEVRIEGTPGNYILICNHCGSDVEIDDDEANAYLNQDGTLNGQN